MSGFWQMFLDRWQELLELLLEHLNMTSLAVLLSLAIGVPLGLLITKSRPVASAVIGVANVMQSIPSIALLAFLVPFIGIGQKPAIIMVVLYALLPIIKNTYTGITSIDPKVMESAAGIGLTRMQQLFRVQLPMAAPFIMAGVRISAVTAVGTVTIAAFAGARGLGWFINLGLNANDPNLVLLGAIPASILALLVDFVLSKLERAITPEGLKPPDRIVQLSRARRVGRSATALALALLMFVVPVGASFAKTLHREEHTIVVGSTNFTEAIILGYLYSELISENTDIAVEEKFNLNGSPLAFAAIERGDIDMFTDYTGVISPILLKQPMETDTQKVYDTVVRLMADEHDIEVSKPLGFSNEYVISASPEAAEKYGLETLSDLIEAAGQLRFGCTTAFTQREDLLPKMEEDFGIEFKSVTGLEGNIRYQAISSGEVDVTDAFSTDAMTVKVDLVPLRDDLSFFPPYQAVNLVREDVFEQYPQLRELLAKLEGAITTREMAQMNYAVDVDGENPRNVAREYLKSKGLID
ncbi:ABC transporter permease/substrate-binding protein [Feifania hominis]|uniref:ABC transporter permease/substrate-binding protein n=1 Tax=Feifania hominis TaxID=2763660 RepID=A0A926DCC3_9FIRM|nr:ABC transporter permease/substrate-binding protein [Feifania hominis]MBC8535267.1 ABC transporter permease/substrate-binding protein [Feifania hominis]